MGCLFAIMAGAFPRFGLFIFWLLRPARVDAAFDTWIWPLIGLIFFPFATLLYVVLHVPGVGLSGWEWFWVATAAVFDLMHLAASATQRREAMAYRPGRPPASSLP